MARLRAPEAISRALAMQADAAAEQMGTEHAVAMLRANKRLDLRHPAAGEALRALIRHAAVGDAATVLALTKARAETHADFADVHAVYALALERFSSRDSARTPYQRALELEPEHVEALSALGRMHREAGDLAGALDYQRRAASAAPNLAGPALALAQSLVARAERDEALSILEEALWAHPSDARAALQLASLLAHEGGDPSRSLALAQQALRLGAGSEAEQLVARLRGTTP
jgi:tetratricopeptide (TPR) repeat protein